MSGKARPVSALRSGAGTRAGCATAASARKTAIPAAAMPRNRRSIDPILDVGGGAVPRSDIDASAQHQPETKHAESHAISKVPVAERLDDVADQRRQHREAEALRHVHRGDAAAGQAVGKKRAALRHDHRAEGAEETEGG